MQHPSTFDSPIAAKKKQTSAFCSVDSYASPLHKHQNTKFTFDQCGSPVRQVAWNASNESFEEIRRAPRKDKSDLPPDRKNLYASLRKEPPPLMASLNQDNSREITPFSLGENP